MSLHPEITDPEELELPVQLAPYADVRVWATSATHVGLSAEVTVNRVRHNVRLDIHWRADEWQLGHDESNSALYNALILSRVDRWDGSREKPTSTAARAKVLDTLTPWLIEVAESTEGHDLLVEAERVALDLELDKITREGQELAERVLELAERVDELDARKRELVNS